VAKNSCEHFPCCYHAIATDCVGGELKRQLDVAVTKQSLYGFWIGSDADQKRGETVAQIVKTKSSWVVIDKPSPQVAVRRKNASLQRNRPQLIFDQHVGNPRLRAF